MRQCLFLQSNYAFERQTQASGSGMIQVPGSRNHVRPMNSLIIVLKIYLFCIFIFAFLTKYIFIFYIFIFYFKTLTTRILKIHSIVFINF